MPETVIRAARADDAETIARFQERMALETEDRALDAATVRAGVRGALADPSRGRYLVAERAGEVVGSLLLTLEWTDWRDGTFWWIQSVYVTPGERGTGVFRALYRAVEAQALADPLVRGLRLYVERDNAAAQAIYRRLGMQETDYRLFEVERARLSAAK